MSVTPTYRWVSRLQAYDKAIEYMRGRANGVITSLKTSSPKINNAGIDGFEWGTATCIAGRPGSGKSLYKEQLIREFFEINTTEKFRVLDFDLEMLLLVTALREFSKVLGKSYKYLCSAEKDEFNQKLTKAEFQRLQSYVEQKKKLRDSLKDYPIDVVENPPTPEEFEEIIEEYLELHSTEENGTKIYPKVVISLDHARLIKKKGRAETDMLYELSYAIIRLKKKYPSNVIFIILNHLNRTVTEATRCEDGKISNYIVDADILGADAMSQACDIMIAIDRPYKRKIRFYGAERFIVDEYMLIFNFLKVRNGDTRISFFEGEFHKMQIVERDTPPTARDMKKARE